MPISPRLSTILIGLLLCGNLARANSLTEPPADLLSGRGSVAVFYPNVSEPFRSIFSKIIEGIEERAKGRIKSYIIDSNKIDHTELNSQLKRHDTKVVIALGRVGIKAATALERDISVIVGGVVSTSDIDQQTVSGISLNPDPAVLLQKLKLLQPDVRRVFVVYNPQSNEAVIKRAREVGKEQNIEIVAYEARNIADAARAYSSVFSNADKTHDALWLPSDTTTVEESTLLPLILKQSWDSSLPFFSSSLIHVKRGALFALYPNNLELGRNLGNSALGVLAGDIRKKGIQPLRAVHIAVNLRTAGHLGLHISAQQQRGFDAVFPEQ
ncbi:MAG: hypothetical protein RL748_41 [Pseudomonadota bacterium]|jgi:putative ABC transport system substrate-binding protein